MNVRFLIVMGLLIAAFLAVQGGRLQQAAVADPPVQKTDLENLKGQVKALDEKMALLMKARPEVIDAAADKAETAKLEMHAPFLNVMHFGAKGDGVTDDTAALQAALDAAGNNAPWGVRGTIIMMPPGEYVISSTLNVYRMAFEMVGCGFGNSPAYKPSPGGASVIRWNGPADKPMMKIRDSYGITLRRLRWEGKVGVGGTTAINLNWVSSDQQGTNGRTVIEQCHFGRYAHTSQGIHKGDLACGVLMDGENGNNDEFQIHRCVFSNCTSAGVRIVNTQSVWGSINDCTISEGGAGVETAASVTAYNLCFDACNPDFKISSTAYVCAFGWQSERSKKLAELGPDSSLMSDGGYLQLGAIVGDVMIDAFPSESAQVILQHMRFTENARSPRPKIRFGPSEKDKVVGGGFRIQVLDSRGLYPDQFQLAGKPWATVPESRGAVEFRGLADKFYHFRNFLRMTPPSAHAIDPSRIDLTITDDAATLNAPGPISLQGTTAKVYAGNGSPENSVAAGVGSLYLRTDGGIGTSLYIKESGDEKTGWISK